MAADCDRAASTNGKNRMTVNAVKSGTLYASRAQVLTEPGKVTSRRDLGERNCHQHTVLAAGWSMVVVALVALAWLPAAHAGLGDSSATVQQDRMHMKGQLRQTSQSGYSVEQITLPSGTVVHEYIAAGKVFAVSWRGPVIPDLRQMLSTYFPQYEAAAARPHAGGHHHLSIARPGFVMRAGGHMRAHFGLAYVPGLLPQGFSVDDIR